MIIQNGETFSKATSHTRNTREDAWEISSLKEEEVSTWETAVARAKLPRMHGRNYGRSLTLEMEDDGAPSFLTSKWIWVFLLILIGLGIAGVMLLVDNTSVQEMRPSKSKSKANAKIKVRKPSKR
jgi:hypothetical protein